MNKLLLFSAIIFMVNAKNAFTQYHLAHTQFTKNEILINPAYAGSKNYYTVAANVREQWSGIQGAPSTQSVTAFGPVPGKNVGIGVSIVNDMVGVTNQQLLNVSYAYKINLETAFFTMGLNAGSRLLSNNYNKLNLHCESDDSFISDRKRNFAPYMGLGAYFEKDNYNIGISAPMFLHNIFNKKTSHNVSANGVFFFVSGAYLMPLPNGYTLKTGTLIKGVSNAKLEMDLLTTLYINESWNFGLSYKSLNALSIHFEYGCNEQWYFTYSYDLATSKMLFNQGGSHEVTLSLLINQNRKHFYKNPRYF